MQRIVAGLCLLAVALAHGDHGSHVLDLSESNFDAEIAKNAFTLVEFFAPWCGHCKRLAPEYEEAGHRLEGREGVKLAKVDCTEQQELCGKYDVQGYPTIKIFRNDGSEPSEYQGARNADGIVKFLEKQLAPAVTILDSAEAVTDFSKTDDVTVVAFVADDAAETTFTVVAKALRNEYSFALVKENAAAVAGELGVSDALPTAVLLKKTPGEEKAVFTGAFKESDIKEFVAAEAFPLVGEIGPENYQKYLERNLPLLWMFLEPDTDATKETLSAARSIAKEFKGRISFVHLDGVRWSDHAKHFGLSGTPPGVVIEDRENEKKYAMAQDKPLTAATLRAHVEGFVAKTLEPTVKSEEEPADNSGPVKVVVGKSFEKIVMDDTKDVLLEFYAPWCGHCKQLAPKFEKLGEMFKDEESIVIAKVDATENDTPASIRGFPTILFYRAGDKSNPMAYEGERTEEAMAEFVRANANTLKGGDAAKPTDSNKDEL